MKLFLVRHGSALSAFEDSERPLSTEGIKEVNDLAKKFSLLNELPKQVFHSGILRAEQTANILCQNLKLPSPLKGDNLTPSSYPDFWADRCDHLLEPTMLVGHMPYMGELVGQLTQKPLSFNTANLIVLECNSDGVWNLVFNSENY